MRDLPPLNSLRCFEAAGRHESFSRAADELHLTHGAVSRQVRQLEDQLGTALFERRNRGVFLTDNGKRLLLQVGSALDQLEATINEIRQAETRNELRVACGATVAMRWLIPRLSRFYERYPEITLHLTIAVVLEPLVRGGCDVALTWLSVTRHERSFAELLPLIDRIVPLMPDAIGPVCSPAYAEQHAGRLLESVVLYSATVPQIWAHWRAVSGQATRPEREQTYGHFYLAIEAAAAGLGVTVASKHLVADDLASGRLVAPFGFSEIEEGYAALIPRDATAHGAAELFVDWLAAEARRA